MAPFTKFFNEFLDGAESVLDSEGDCDDSNDPIGNPPDTEESADAPLPVTVSPSLLDSVPSSPPLSTSRWNCCCEGKGHSCKNGIQPTQYCSQLQSGHELKSNSLALLARMCHQSKQPQQCMPTQTALGNCQCLANGKPNQKVKAADLNSQFPHQLDWDTAISQIALFNSQHALLEFLKHCNYDEGTVEDWSLCALAAKAHDHDNPNWHQAMNGPD